MGQALYRKYRSKKLSEIVGQEHITKALENALETNRISHAYLFTGPRGIGKTSIARILAFEVNGLPYDETTTHLDIIEIDAASNRRIDEVRDLREKVHITPTSAKYKVYIIDEVHMLTREAFNALLKTLEEPPEHVIFILATTEAHKLPETIISRTQHFTFRPIEEEKVARHLATIAKAEKIDIDKAALKLLAEHGGGSFRDSISLLDQIQHSATKITVDNVRTMLGLAPEETVTSLTNYLDKGDAKNLIQTLQQLRNQGVEPVITAKQVSELIRRRIIENRSESTQSDLMLLERLLDIATAPDPYAALEIVLLQAVFHSKHLTTPPMPPVIDSPSAPKTKPAAKPPVSTKKNETNDNAAEAKVSAKTNTSTTPINADIWPEVLTAIKKEYNTLYGVLRMAQPHFEGHTITLVLKFTFHQKRLNEPKNRQLIANAVTSICGQNPDIVCVVNEDASPPDTPAVESTSNDLPQSNPLGTISNIFGSAELLES